MEVYNQTIFNESLITYGDFEDVTINGTLTLNNILPNKVLVTDTNSNVIGSNEIFVTAPSNLVAGSIIKALSSNTVGDSSYISEDGTGVIITNGNLRVINGTTVLFNVNYAPGSGITKIAQCLIQSSGSDGDAILQVLTVGGVNALDVNTATNVVTVNQLNTVALQASGQVNFDGIVEYNNNYTRWQPIGDGEIIDIYTSNGSTLVMNINTSTQTLTVQNITVNGTVTLGAVSLGNLTVTGTTNLQGNTTTSNISTTGTNLIKAVTDADGVFQVQNSGGAWAFKVNTSTGIVSAQELFAQNLANFYTGKVLSADSFGNIVGSSTPETQLVYINNLTSDAQTQINGKISGSSLTSGKHLIANGSGSATNSAQVSEASGTLTITGSNTLINTTSTSIIPAGNGQAFNVYNNTGAINYFNVNTSTGITTAGELNAGNLTASTVLVADASKNITSSSVTNTTLGYLDATSSVQTQLNGKQPALSGLVSGKHIIANSSSTITDSSILSESGTTLTCAGSIIPSATTTYNLGNSSTVFNNIYGSNFWASTAGYSSYGGYVLMGYNNGGTAQDTVYCGNSRPLNNNSVNCGTSSNYWNNTYSNTISTYTISPLTGAGVACSGNWLPSTNGGASLGLNGQKWANLWTTSNAQIGGAFGWSGQTTWSLNMTMQGPNAVNLQSMGTGWNTYSSSNYKENIKPMVSGLDIISKLNPVSYTWKEGHYDNIPGYNPDTHHGLIAQEVQKVYPQCVQIDEAGEGGMDYTKLIVFCIKAIQEQQATIEKIHDLIPLIKAQSDKITQLEEIITKFSNADSFFIV
jgi:hypothetical protein